jgi:hypothetical protein
MDDYVKLLSRPVRCAMIDAQHFDALFLHPVDGDIGSGENRISRVPSCVRVVHGVGTLSMNG